VVPEPRKLKGVNFRGTLGALERLRGKDTVAAVLARVPGEPGVALRDGAVLTGGWYPAAWYHALLVAIVEETGGGEPIVAQLARDAVMNDLETIFRILSLFVSPTFALQNAIKVLRRYVDGGTVEVLAARDGEARYRFTDFHGYTRLMWTDFVASTEAVALSMRLKDVKTRTPGSGGDGPSLELVMTWTR
jgi:hypothetical protein